MCFERSLTGNVAEWTFVELTKDPAAYAAGRLLFERNLPHQESFATVQLEGQVRSRRSYQTTKDRHLRSNCLSRVSGSYPVQDTYQFFRFEAARRLALSVGFHSG
jgi:hypothetical protein